MSKRYLKYYLLFILVYFGQGIYHLPSQSVFYWLKDTLNLSVAQIAYIGAFATIPWCVKPLYGLISDLFILFGYRRKSYLILNYISIGLIGLYIWFFGLTIVSLIAVNILCAIAFAMNDVCCDGIMVEKGQQYNMTGKFQSIQWASINVAALLTGVCGGIIAKYLNYRYANLFVAIFIFVILLFLLFNYKEKKYRMKVNKNCFKGIKSGLKNKQMWLAVAFLFCLWFSPSFSIGLMFKMRDILKFDKVFIGLLGTTSAGLGILGAIIYYNICRKINLRKLLIVSTILSALFTFCYLYYPNWQIALLYSILFGTAGMISNLIILDFAARITPKEAECFIFAGLCSILNLSAMLSRVIGGFLYSYIGLNNLIIISGGFTLLCLGFIPFLKISNNIQEIVNE